MQADPQTQQNPPTQQPITQPGFTVGHNRPFAQPQQPHPQQGQYAQPPGYVPPNQYGMAAPNQQAYGGDRRTQLEILFIDQKLSSGCYCFWNFWLYIMIIEGLAGIYTSGVAMLSWWSYVFLFLMAIAILAYGIVMMTAMKNKDLGKTEIGVRLAITVMVLYLPSLYAQYTAYCYLVGAGQAKKIILPMAVGFGCYYIAAMVVPALKVRKHLQAREALIQKAAVPYNA